MACFASESHERARLRKTCAGGSLTVMWKLACVVVDRGRGLQQQIMKV